MKRSYDNQVVCAWCYRWWSPSDWTLFDVQAELAADADPAILLGGGFVWVLEIVCGCIVARLRPSDCALELFSSDYQAFLRRDGAKPARVSPLVSSRMNSRIAFITGITGQDGSYLAELLIDRGYAVHGLVRRASLFNRSRIEHLRLNPAIGGKSLFLHYGDLNDTTSLRRLFQRIKPSEVYHLAGQSHVGLSFEIPEATVQEVANATLGLLEILRDQDPPVRLYHASSSEIFGAPAAGPQNEDTPQCPTSPYGCAKSFATQLGRVYRDAYGLFVCNGIAYNHESPRRGENFVTRKISLAVARIVRGKQKTLSLGNVDTARDWGFAREYVEAMWLILQQEQPADYILATGESHTLAEFLAAAFGHVGLDWRSHVTFDARFVRPKDPVCLVGDASRARRQLGWEAKTKLEALARVMVDADLAEIDAKQ